MTGGLPFRVSDPENPGKRRRLDLPQPGAASQPRQQPQHGHSHPYSNRPLGPSSSPPTKPKAVDHAQPPPHNSFPQNGLTLPHSSRVPSAPTIHPPFHVQPARKNGPGYPHAHRTTPVVLAAPPRLPSLIQRQQPKPSFCQPDKSSCSLPAAPPEANAGCKPQLQSHPTPQTHFLDSQSDVDPSAAPAASLRAPNIKAAPPTGTHLPGNSSCSLLFSKAPSNAPTAHLRMPASHRSPNDCISTDRGSGSHLPGKPRSFKASPHEPQGAHVGTSTNRTVLLSSNASLSKAPSQASAAPSTAPVGNDLTRNGPSIQPCKVAAKASAASIPAPTSVQNANASGSTGISPPNAGSHAQLKSIPQECGRPAQHQTVVFPPGGIASPRTHPNANAASDKQLLLSPGPLAEGILLHKPRQHTGTVKGSGSRKALGKAEGSTHLAWRSAKSAPLICAVQPFLRTAPQPSPAGCPKTLSDNSRSSKWSLPLRGAFSGQSEHVADGTGKEKSPGTGALSNDVADPAKAFSQWPGRPAFVTYSRATPADAPAQPKSSSAPSGGNAACENRRSHELDKTKPSPTTGPSKVAVAGELKAASIPGTSAGKPQHKGPSPDREAKQATPAPTPPSSKVQPKAAISALAPVQLDAAPTGKSRHATGKGTVSVPKAGVSRLVAAPSATPHAVPPAVCSGRDPPRASSPAVGKSEPNRAVIGRNAQQPCSMLPSSGTGQPDVVAAGASSPKGLIPCVKTVSKGQPLDNTARQAAYLGQPGSQAQQSGAPHVSNGKIPAADPNASTTDAAPQSIATGLIPEPVRSAEKARPSSSVAKPRSPEAAAHEAPTVDQPMIGSKPSQKASTSTEERAGSAAAEPVVAPREDAKGTQAGQAKQTMTQSPRLAAVSVEVIDLAEDSDTPAESAPTR